THRTVLHDVRLHARPRRAFGLQAGQCGVLLGELDRLLPLLPGVAPCGQQVGGQPATPLKLLRKESPWLLIGRQSVLAWFTQAGGFTPSRRVVTGEGPSSPA